MAARQLEREVQKREGKEQNASEPEREADLLRPFLPTVGAENPFRPGVGDQWPVLIFEIESGQSNFGIALDLARYISSPKLSGITKVAFLPESISGHAVLLAIACDEIAMHPDATIGEAGIGEQVIRPGTRSGYVETARETHSVPVDLVRWVAENQKLPVPNFSAGGIATPADAALVMQLGAESVFVGSGIFKSNDPVKRGRAIVQAAANFEDPATLAEISRGLGPAMPGLEVTNMPDEERMAGRGW